MGRLDPRRLLGGDDGDSKSDSTDTSGPADATASIRSGDSSTATHGEDPITKRINPWIRSRPWTVVAIFLVVTAVFMGGFLIDTEQEAGQDQFTEGLDAVEAQEEMEDNFDRESRATGGTTAQLFIEDDRNVLSKPNLLRMLEYQDRVENENGLRVVSSTSPASLTAQQIDPTADTPEKQYRTIDRASQREIDSAIAAADEAAGLSVSQDFTRESARANVAILAMTFDTPPNAETGDYASLQLEAGELVNEVDGFAAGENVVLFADAVIEEEVFDLLTDTAMVIFPATIGLILLFLLIAYRDPLDLGLGLAALVLTFIWTFGFMGYARVPFSESMVTVFPLLLAVGIDFGIHIINRYREERAAGAAINEAMGITTGQLTAAFMIVTVTTVFSFLANLTSSIESTRDFGLVAAAGIVFTFLIFGIFLPAGKVALDQFREGRRIPTFSTSPLGGEQSFLGRILPIGTKIAKTIPVIVLVSGLLLGATAGAYGTGVDTEFSQEIFFPDQDRVDQYQSLPAPFTGNEYTFITVLDYLENDFGQGFVSSVTVYVDDREVRGDRSLRDIDRATTNPPDALVSADRRAESTDILRVIEAEAERNPEFDQTVRRTDTNGDGIPDNDVDDVYAALLETDSRDDALDSITSDRSATRIVYEVDVDADQTDATAAAQQVADEMAMDATPTGELVVQSVVIDQITESAINSLFAAFALTGVFLMLTYRWLEGRAVYGLINLVPVVVTVGLLAGTMRWLDIALTPINAPILAVSIGLGVDYTVHFMHRFVDEFESGSEIDEALLVTIRGTGGALTGSMLTTVSGLGVLYLALIPLIMEFGILLALGVFYAYLTSILLLPSTIVVWDRIETRFEVADRLPW